MVILLVLYPLVAVAGLYALEASLPIELVNAMSASVAVTATFSLVILVAVLAAARRSRENSLLMSAWLFLFCGLAVLFLGSIIEPFLSGSDSWTEELLSVASFFPLLFFAILIASPLRILILPRRTRFLYVGGGILALLVVFAIVFFPWLFIYEGPRFHSSTKHLLRLVRPLLDTLLAEPLALLVLVIGLSSGSGPYFLTGLGLFLFLPEDILEHFQLLGQLNSHGVISNLISIASRLYLLNGALLAAFRAPIHMAAAEEKPSRQTGG